MTGSEDQFQPSDVTLWGVIALFCGAIALLSANFATLMPHHVLTGLHSTRLDGGSLNNLKSQLSDLREEAVRLRTENSRIMTQLTLAEQSRGEMTRRVGAIESTLPVLLESSAGSELIDRSLLTSSTTKKPDEVLQVDGGSVAITTQSLNGDAASEQPMPAMIDAATKTDDLPLIPAGATLVAPSGYGVALGPQVTIQDAYIAWKDISRKAGPLLLGLGPLLSGNAGKDQQRLVAGPLRDYVEAEQICTRMIRIGISCLPVEYAGYTLPQ